MKKMILFSASCLLFICMIYPAFAETQPPNSSPSHLELIDKELAAAKAVEDAKRNAPPAKEEKSILHRILMYIPNRIIDLTDIITMNVGVGPEASAEVTFTKFCELGGSYGDRYFLTKGYNRQYGGGYHSGYNASFFFLNNELAYTDYTFGSVEPYFMLNRDSDFPSPFVKPYSNGLEDFWKIGVHLGWIVDLSVAIHPVAIANFITGFFFIRLTDTEEL